MEKQKENLQIKNEDRITAEKFIGHLKTVLAHRREVRRNCFAVGLYYQGLTHDLSKFSPVEFLNSCRYYQGGTQSPNNQERIRKGYSESWMHHKGRNRHHYEYWTDYRKVHSPDLNPVHPVRMPRRFVAEMLMDRIAASKVYHKDDYTDHAPLAYYRKGRGKELMDPQTAKELERMLRILDQRGEQELFRFVRGYYLKGYPM